MKKILNKYYFAFLLLTLSQGTLALSLGEIKVKSTFAQPFHAEIALPSYTQKEIKNLKISLASSRLFSEQGMEVLPILRKFKFSIEKNKQNKLYIKVKTKISVKELSISFLVDASWPGGNIIKNYDVLLTPEAITQYREQAAEAENNQFIAKATPVQKKTNSTKAKVRKSKSHLANTNSSKRIQTAKKRTKKSASRFTINKNGRVEYNAITRGESLSLVAKRIRVGRDISHNQMIVALFQENPRAFSNNDINRLKLGVKLTLNDINDATSISKNEATNLARQYLAGAIKPQNKSSVIAQSQPKSAAKIKVAPKDRLVISSAKEDPIPLDVMDKIKKEQLNADEEKVISNTTKAAALNTVNQTLKDRISELEIKRDAAAESLFLATLQQNTLPEISNSSDNSLSQQSPNMIVTGTDLSLAETESLSLMERIEKHQTAISISGIALLSMTFLGIRKKEEVLDIVHNFTSKFNRKT